MPQIPFSLWFKKSSKPKCTITLEDINEKLEWLINHHKRIDKIMTTLDDVLNSVKDESGVDDSVIALLTGIRQQLLDVLAGGLTISQQEKVEAIFNAVKANKDKVAAAIVANPAPASGTGG